MPRLSDASGALASRFILLVLTRSFYGRENPRLTSELLAEAPSIFNWALEGLDRLNQRGYFVNPESGAEAIQQMEDPQPDRGLHSRALPRRWRLTRRVGNAVEETAVTVTVDALWAAWKAWCEGETARRARRPVFGRDLRAVVPTLKRARPRDANDREYTYAGIGLRRDYMAWDLGPLGPSGRGDGSGPSGPSGPSDPPLYRPPAPETLWDPVGWRK